MKKIFTIITLYIFVLMLLQGCITYQQTELSIKNNTSFLEKKFNREYEGGKNEKIMYVINYPKKKNLTENVSEEIRNMEMKTFELINKERENFGLKKLKWNDELAYVARKHSEYLASLNKGFVIHINISHKGKDGKYHDHRLNKNNIFYFESSAENIFGISIVKKYYEINMSPAEYYKKNELPEKAVEGWMLSKGHRKNILNPEFDESGIGIAKDKTGTNYIFTQIFIKRAECGYRFGRCCEKEGYYPYCFIPLQCIGKICVKEGDVIYKNVS